MTTYVLGAGASRHVGYPLSNSMGSELLAWMRSATQSVLDYPGTANFLEETFDETANFEELLNNIGRLVREYKNGTLDQRTMRTRVADARFTVAQALRDWFTIIRKGDARAYRRFATEIVQPGDHIITFNYDVSLERELRVAKKWAVGDGYGFPINGLPADSAVRVLKLHGSVNWLALMGGGARSGTFTVGNSMFGSRPVIPKNELDFLGYPDLTDPAFARTSAAMPALILPARTKEFFFRTSMGTEWKGSWGALWDQAQDALHTAETVVICGYSLLPVDERARPLVLYSALKHARVDVACGKDSHRIVGEFRQNGYKSCTEARESLFEDWVAAQAAPAGFQDHRRFDG